MSSLDILITGANSGIGFETAKQLLLQGHRVHVVCRDEPKTDQTVRDLVQFGRVIKAGRALRLDDLESVRAFCQDEHALASSLNVLVCNAGVMGVPRFTRTAQGYESHVGINYLGHFLLTRLLLGRLRRGALASHVPSRVVNVSGEAYTWAKGEVDIHKAFEGGDDADAASYSFPMAYAHSKLFQIWDSHTLTEQEGGAAVVSVALHPGVIHTNLMRDMPAKTVKMLLNVGPEHLKTVQQGASSVVRCCVIDALPSSTPPYYFVDDVRAQVDQEMTPDAASSRRQLEQESWKRVSAFYNPGNKL